MWLWLELSRPNVKVVLGNDAHNDTFHKNKKLLCYNKIISLGHLSITIKDVKVENVRRKSWKNSKFRWIVHQKQAESNHQRDQERNQKGWSSSLCVSKISEKSLSKSSLKWICVIFLWRIKVWWKYAKEGGIHINVSHVKLMAEIINWVSTIFICILILIKWDNMMVRNICVYNM